MFKWLRKLWPWGKSATRAAFCKIESWEQMVKIALAHSSSIDNNKPRFIEYIKGKYANMCESIVGDLFNDPLENTAYSCLFGWVAALGICVLGIVGFWYSAALYFAGVWMSLNIIPMVYEYTSDTIRYYRDSGSKTKVSLTPLEIKQALIDFERRRVEMEREKSIGDESPLGKLLKMVNNEILGFNDNEVWFAHNLGSDDSRLASAQLFIQTKLAKLTAQRESIQRHRDALARVFSACIAKLPSLEHHIETKMRFDSLIEAGKRVDAIDFEIERVVVDTMKHTLAKFGSFNDVVFDASAKALSVPCPGAQISKNDMSAIMERVVSEESHFMEALNGLHGALERAVAIPI